MRIGRRTFLASMTASVAGPAVLRLARAQAPQVTLKLHHFFSSVSCGHAEFLSPWARKVEAESNGRLRVDIFPSMQLGGAPAALLDQVRDGLADIVWAVPANTPGRFPKIEAFELPFVPSRRALVNSKALEDYAAANLQDEFRDVHPIAFSCRDHGVVHANRAVRAIEDLKGLRLHVPNRLAGETARTLGALPVNAPVPQLPMAITGHVIDGCLDPWDLVPGLRLQDMLKFHTDFEESSLSTTPFVLAMNKASYDRLPRDLKTVIDSNSGQVAAGMAGAMWDLQARSVADMVRGRGDQITMLPAEDIARWRKAAEPVIAAWLKELKARKLDGGKLVASAQASLAKYANEPEPKAQEPPQKPQPPEPQAAKPPEPKTPPQPKAVTQAPEPKAVTQTPSAPPVPQAKAATIAPQAVTPAPTAKPVPRRELDIPL